VKNYLFIGLTVLAAGMIVGGCAGSEKYKKLETEKNQEIAALRQEKSVLEQQNTALEKDVADQKRQTAAAEQRAAAMEQQNAAAIREAKQLEIDKAHLIAAARGQQQEYQKLLTGLSSEVQKGELELKQYKNMLTVDLADQVFFDSGRATLKPEGKRVLKKLGEALKGYNDKIIRVVGHTDNKPVPKSLHATFPSNWELSVLRATTVVRILQEAGVPPESMIASGRGEYEPTASNNTAEGRQKNRRIAIMLYDKKLVNELTETPAEPAVETK
jgi:chemotaxis protein MotB